MQFKYSVPLVSGRLITYSANTAKENEMNLQLKQLKEQLLEANQIQFGEDLDEITQYVDE